jgi:hypothetical protein
MLAKFLNGRQYNPVVFSEPERSERLHLFGIKKGDVSCQGPELFHVTEKLSPLLESTDGWALTAPELETTVICWAGSIHQSRS